MTAIPIEDGGSKDAGMREERRGIAKGGDCF